MDYNEFRFRVGKLSMPENVDADLLEGENSIHFLVHLGVIKDGQYFINASPLKMDLFVRIIDLLESRGAVREKDYAVCCSVGDGHISIGVHTTNKFLSDEDFEDNIQRIDTK